jgi:hypothetical protein
MDEALQNLLDSIVSETPPCAKCAPHVVEDCANYGYECPAFESYSNQGYTRRKPKPRIKPCN